MYTGEDNIPQARSVLIEDVVWLAINLHGFYTYMAGLSFV
jgi:hypothetical protein